MVYSTLGYLLALPPFTSVRRYKYRNFSYVLYVCFGASRNTTTLEQCSRCRILFYEDELQHKLQTLSFLLNMSLVIVCPVLLYPTLNYPT
jgi:hypothetical protein